MSEKRKEVEEVRGSTPEPRKASPWKRRLVVIGLILAGVVCVVLALTVFASMAGERHMALADAINGLTKETFATSGRSERIADALSDYDFARALQVWFASIGALLSWIGIGLHLFRQWRQKRAA